MKKLWRPAAHTVSLVNNSAHLRVTRTDVMVSVLTAIKKKNKLSRKADPTISAYLLLSLPQLQGMLNNLQYLQSGHIGVSNYQGLLILRKAGIGKERHLNLISFYVLDLSHREVILSHYYPISCKTFLSYFLLCELGYNGF